MKDLNLQNIMRPEAFQTRISKLVRKKVLGITKNFEGNILDVCCGNGLFLLEYCAQNGERDNIIGLDYDFEAIQEGKLLFADNNFGNDNFINGDALNLPFPDDFFDNVFCLNTLINFYPFKKIEDLVKELYRVCNKGGKILFDFRNINNPVLKFRYYKNANSGRLTTYGHRKSDFSAIFNKLDIKKIIFVPIGISLPLISLGYLTVLEK